MKLNKQKNILFLSELVRIILTIIILYYLNIPIFIKIILIYICDNLDCSFIVPDSIPFKGPLFIKNINICRTLFYQKSDKITDTICYSLLLIYILDKGGLSKNYNYLIILLFLYRLVGVYLFLIKNNRKFLFYFPNFFLEICLGLMIICYFPILKNFKEIIILIIIVSKIIIEYNMHYNIKEKK